MSKVVFVNSINNIKKNNNFTNKFWQYIFGESL